MAGGQALVCGNRTHVILMGLPPFSWSSLCFSFLPGVCQRQAAAKVLMAAVADSKEPLGSDRRPQPSSIHVNNLLVSQVLSV